LFCASLGCVLTLSCVEPTRHSATVELEVDGQRHDYQTGRAAVEERADPRTYSVYLHPSDPDGDQPFVCFRTFSGNPVGHLWLRYRAPGKEGGKLGKFECFVPGKLTDGRDTLGWTEEDGSARDKTVTGEADCEVELKRDGDTLRFSFDARLSPARAIGKKQMAADEAAGKAPAAKVAIKGSAVVEL
jgi:hypothetical protein